MADSNYTPLDRRPIKARSTRWAAAITNRLAAKGLTPNAISVAGMIIAIVGGGFLACTHLGASGGGIERLFWLLGIACAQVRLLCNLFDGMVAVQTGSASPVGELYNEVPDRVSDAAILIGLGYAAGSSVTLGYLAACMALMVAYVRAMGKAAGAPNDFRGPMAKPHRMFAVTLLGLYMAFAPTAWQPAWGLPTLVLALILIGGLITIYRRLQGAANHLRQQG